MVSAMIFCVFVLAAGAYAACVDNIPCAGLEKQFCADEYETVARQLCAKHCGYCQEIAYRTMNKRLHSQGSPLADHCWDNSGNHVLDPFCALLTTTTPTTTTTTTEPTTTTTTEPTTTTTEPTTTTTTLPPTTTARQCSYEVLDNTTITSTDFGTDKTVVQNTSVTLNYSVVHFTGDFRSCENVCTQSQLLNDGLECWGITYNSIDRCYLYYYNRPLYIPDTVQHIYGTTLYLKRCTDDPPTTPKSTTSVFNFTEAFATTAKSETIKASNSPSNAASTISSGIHYTSAVSIAPTKSSISHFTSSHISGGKSTQHSPTGTHHAMTTVGGGGTSSTYGPDTRGPSGGIDIVSSTSYQIVGGTSPKKGMCFFNNQTFNKGEHWKDGCRYDCECFDPDTNAAICKDICTLYTKFPTSCTLNHTGGCCPRLECGNHTDLVNTTGENVGANNITEGGCTNKLDKCDFYSNSACEGLYEPWARANCALRCGFCDYKEPCIDRLSYCSLYDLDSVCTTYGGWARHNCRQSCAICK